MSKRNQPKREKQLRDLRNRIARLEASREAAIKMLVKAERELPTLRKQAKRLADALLATQVESPAPVPSPTPPPPEPEPVKQDLPTATVTDDGSDPGEIPTWLRRGMATQKAVDGIIEEESRRLAALPDPRTKEKKAQRRAIEKEKREADLRGQLRKMPLTGRDALKFLAK